MIDETNPRSLDPKLARDRRELMNAIGHLIKGLYTLQGQSSQPRRLSFPHNSNNKISHVMVVFVFALLAHCMIGLNVRKSVAAYSARQAVQGSVVPSSRQRLVRMSL